MSRPAVSVVIPARDRAPDLPAALASVQAQTFQDWELILVDDASTDGSLDLLTRLAREEPRLRVLANRRRMGPGAARNRGVAQARGAWVAFLDSDDTWKPGKLEGFLARAEDGVVLVGSDYLMVDDVQGTRETMRGFILDVMLPWWEGYPTARAVIDCPRLRADFSCITDPDVMAAMALGGYLWPQTSAVMVRREAFDRVGGFPERLPRTADMYLWMWLRQQGPLVYLDQPLSIYDVTRRNAAAPGDKLLDTRYHLRFLRRFGELAALEAKGRALRSERIAAHYRMCGFHAAAAGRRAAAGLYHGLALLGSAELRRQWRFAGRGYFDTPW